MITPDDLNAKFKLGPPASSFQRSKFLVLWAYSGDITVVEWLGQTDWHAREWHLVCYHPVTGDQMSVPLQGIRECFGVTRTAALDFYIPKSVYR
jgi:hypothetical protein